MFMDITELPIYPEMDVEVWEQLRFDGIRPEDLSNPREAHAYRAWLEEVERTQAPARPTRDSDNTKE
jgi:hypothetical protein